jgi:hypothetical protein
VVVTPDIGLLHPLRHSKGNDRQGQRQRQDPPTTKLRQLDVAGQILAVAPRRRMYELARAQRFSLLARAQRFSLLYRLHVMNGLRYSNDLIRQLKWNKTAFSPFPFSFTRSSAKKSARAQQFSLARHFPDGATSTNDLIRQMAWNNRTAFLPIPIFHSWRRRGPQRDLPSATSGRARAGNGPRRRRRRRRYLSTPTTIVVVKHLVVVGGTNDCFVVQKQSAPPSVDNKARVNGIGTLSVWRRTITANIKANFFGTDPDAMNDDREIVHARPSRFSLASNIVPFARAFLMEDDKYRRFYTIGKLWY